MRAFLCFLFHRSTQYAGGQYLRCRTCRREWQAAHYNGPLRREEPKPVVDRGCVELERICGIR